MNCTSAVRTMTEAEEREWRRQMLDAYRYQDARFPKDASCADCGAAIPARQRLYLRIGPGDIVCRPWQHSEEGQ